MNTKFNKILFEDNLTIVKHLRDSRLFKNLPEEFLKEFVNVAECVDYPEKSEILIVISFSLKWPLKENESV